MASTVAEVKFEELEVAGLGMVTGSVTVVVNGWHICNGWHFGTVGREVERFDEQLEDWVKVPVTAELDHAIVNACSDHRWLASEAVETLERLGYDMSE